MEEERPKAPFRVAYEVYRNPKARGAFAQSRIMAQKEKQWFTDEDPTREDPTREDPIRLMLSFDDDSSTKEEKLDLQSPIVRHKPYRKLTFFAEDDSSAKDSRISEEPQKETEKEQYEALKKYFEGKVDALHLRDPLIFYDDRAMRVDVGYGPKEAPVLFPELFGGFRETRKRTMKDKKDIVFCEDYERGLNAEKKRLLSVAEEEFTKPLIPKEKVILDPRINGEAEFIESSFNQCRGLVIGEIHSHSSPKRFLIDHMKALAKLGVTRIYMEHLFCERHQRLLDDEELPKELELYLKSLDEGHDVEEKELENENAGTFLNVVRAAKTCGIRVVAIDSEATYAVGRIEDFSNLSNEDSSTVERYKVMNMLMLECFRECDDGGKYVVFVGSGHASTSYHVLGVSDLLCCPNIVIHDKDEEHPVATLESDVDYEKDKKDETHYDFLYYRNNVSKIFEQISKRNPSKGLGF